MVLKVKMFNANNPKKLISESIYTDVKCVDVTLKSGAKYSEKRLHLNSGGTVEFKNCRVEIERID